MMLYKSPESLARIWRRRLDSGQEAGHSTLLALGQDSLHPDSGFVLLTLNRIAKQSGGRRRPTLCSGGDGEFWLQTLMLWRTQKGRGAPVFGGADGGTYAAHLNIVQSRDEHLFSELLTPGYLWLTNPLTLPGSERSDAEYLPFALELIDSISEPERPSMLERMETFAIVVAVLALLLTAWAIV